VLDRALRRVWAACAAAGKPVGVHATDGVTARRYRDAGCTLITTALDAVAITRDTARSVQSRPDVVVIRAIHPRGGSSHHGGRGMLR
jgi:2-keto-3-deoxy-L-rhamnonate aldolase RhmA